ncbi:MAG: AAA family ATPase [Clostridia bacterium]|nr:AAA family ATPase [Clostridia bacterium]
MSKRKVKIRYIAYFAVLIVFGGLLIASVVRRLMTDDAQMAGLVQSETMYVLVALAAVLPVLIVSFIFVNLRRKTHVTSVIERGGDDPAESTEKEGMAKKDKKKGIRAEKAAGNGKRFPTLTEIDNNKEKYERDDYDESITLKTLCENLRNFAANRSLYYDIEDIRRFIAGLTVSHTMILQGMSGTGKTSLAYVFGKFLDNPSTVIPVQPMWKERTDLLGYYNEFTKQFNETPLLCKMYEAGYSRDMFVVVLDEMNIARVEYYFAEFLSMLEIPDMDKRYLGIVSNQWESDPKRLKEGGICVPENMWFIGTANNDDSTFAISDKVYDRAMIMNLDNKAEPFVAAKEKPVHLTYKRFNAMATAARKEYRITRRNERRLAALDGYMIEHFHITFGNRIMKQIRDYIPVYVACGGDELSALDDILSKKVLRKVETQNPIYIKNAANGFCQYLDELFGEDGMPLCKAMMRRFEKNA